MSMERLQPDIYDAILRAARSQENWCGAEEFCRRAGRPIGSEYLVNTLLSGKVQIRSFSDLKKGSLFRDLQESENRKKVLERTCAEFRFAGSTFGPFMKVEIDGQKKLLFKIMHDDGGVILLSPQKNKTYEQSWLRSIVVGVDGKSFAFVFGDNPTRDRGGNCYSLSYRRTFRFEQMDVPYTSPPEYPLL